jgi:RNA polymerase sigma factor (sigma-70 family)
MREPRAPSGHDRGVGSDDLSDETCRRALAAGDGDALAILFDVHIDAVVNAAFRRTANWAAAEDIAELCFVELWRQRHRVVAKGGSLRPWLLGVTANLARRWWRDEGRKRRAVQRLARREPGGDDLAELVASRVDDERRMAPLLAAVRRLPPPQQDVLTLWAWEQLSYDEIADALGLRVGTVKSRLNRARASLAKAEGTGPGLWESPVEPDAGRGGVA